MTGNREEEIQRTRRREDGEDEHEKEGMRMWMERERGQTTTEPAGPRADGGHGTRSPLSFTVSVIQAHALSRYIAAAVAAATMEEVGTRNRMTRSQAEEFDCKVVAAPDRFHRSRYGGGLAHTY